MSKEKTNKPAEKKSGMSGVFDWVSSMILALVVVAMLFAFVFRVVGVSGSSMTNTLHNGDRLLLVTRFYEIERGDIVVINRESENTDNLYADATWFQRLLRFFNNNDSQEDTKDPLIKRVIAVAGDTISIDAATGKVILNGQPLEEPYTRDGDTPQRGFEGELTVPEGYVFAMGDNRHDSLDSRMLGVFSVHDIIGKTVFRLWPDAKGL